MRFKKWQKILLIVLVFLAGVILGWYVALHRRVATNSISIRENSSDYHFINPLLLTDGGSQDSPEYTPLKNTITNYINVVEASKDATAVSVYFRDLNSGRWTGVNEDEQYSPASMLKIAVLIAVLRQAELNPGILSQNISVSPSSINLDATQFYLPKNPIKAGNTYTVRQLISAMIIDSDNNAESLLTQLVGNSQVNKVSSDLQLPISSSGSIDFMSPKLYSRFYRILYNSTYLSDELSEQTLEILSQTNFTEGLVAGLPPNTTVAHKFGERTITDLLGIPINRELHDCGIVYYPNHPYFLCVMTKGTDFEKLQPIITSISGIVWNDVQKNLKDN